MKLYSLLLNLIYIIKILNDLNFVQSLNLIFINVIFISVFFLILSIFNSISNLLVFIHNLSFFILSLYLHPLLIKFIIIIRIIKILYFKKVNQKIHQ